MTQYCACRFRQHDKRLYTYANEGEPLAVGDKGNVETRDGIVTVEVVEVSDKAPPFPCKPITKFAPD